MISPAALHGAILFPRALCCWPLRLGHLATGLLTSALRSTLFSHQPPLPCSRDVYFQDNPWRNDTWDSITFSLEEQNALAPSLKDEHTGQ